MITTLQLQAEAAFRPWWDNVEDNIVYTVLILALFLLPTSVLINTSLDCTYCQVLLTVPPNSQH